VYVYVHVHVYVHVYNMESMLGSMYFLCRPSVFQRTNERAHLIGQNSRHSIFKQTRQPTNAFQLIVLEKTSVGQIGRLGKNGLTPPRPNLGILGTDRFQGFSIAVLFRRLFFIAWSGIARLALFVVAFLGPFDLAAGIFRHGRLQVFQIFGNEIGIFGRFGQEEIQLFGLRNENENE
jgi:hypothetical protein